MNSNDHWDHVSADSWVNESTQSPFSSNSSASSTPLAADATDAKAPDAIEMVEAIFTFAPPETATSAISPEAGDSSNSHWFLSVSAKNYFGC